MKKIKAHLEFFLHEFVYVFGISKENGLLFVLLNELTNESNKI